MDDRMIPLSVLREYMPKLKDEDLKELDPVEYDQSKVPEVSKKHAENVRRKVYLPDMTESFARGVEYAGLMSSESSNVARTADLLSKDTQNRFRDQIAGNTNINEVIDARRPFGAETAFRTLNDRFESMRDIVNVHDFGAIGDGITDDTQAIKNAFEYVTNNHLTLYTERGKVYIVDDIIIEGKSDFGVDSRGVFKRPSDLAKPMSPIETTKTITLLNCKDFYIKEITLDGNHYNNHCFVGGVGNPSTTTTTGYNEGGYGQEWRHSLVIEGCQEFRIDDINILNPSGDGVYMFNEVKNGFIKNIYGKSVDSLGNPVDLGRNLLSMTDGVKNINIDNFVSLNIGHYDMPGGFDIEPNNYEYSYVEDIFINNIHVITGGSGGVGIFDAYDNHRMKNIHINNVYAENTRLQRASFPLLIAGAEDVTILKAHTKENSYLGYSVQIGRSKIAKNIYLPHLIAEGGLLGIYLNASQGENININVEFRNTKDNMLHFGKSHDKVNINFLKGNFISPDNANNRVIYVSPENINLSNAVFSGYIPYDITNGGKRLFLLAGTGTMSNIYLDGLDATGWFDRAVELNNNTFQFAPDNVTNFIVKNSLGITYLQEMKNAKFMAIKGSYIHNLNPTTLTDAKGTYVVKGWIMTKTAYISLDGNPIEDKIYV